MVDLVLVSIVAMLNLVSTPGASNERHELLRRLAPAVGTGHRQGRRHRLVLVDVGGARLELEAALFFRWMRVEALRVGVRLRAVSGFRTFEQQSRLYTCFVECSCNDCRRAARPGYSLHEAGRAIDLDVGDRVVADWLEANAARFGFVRNVREEPWHFEYVAQLSAR
jgi:zinc D-Ala-D-Ala carboxypeptidase